MSDHAFPTKSQQLAPAARLRDYIAIARPDHWIKNVFVIPGAALVIGLSPARDALEVMLLVGAALLATCLIASANYTINEFLDAASDRHHPLKQTRPSADGRMSGKFVCLQWVVLASCGLLVAGWLNQTVLVMALALLVMGVVYNVNPLRTKDRQYLDVLSESINNPIRFMIGWAALDPTVLPPSSILLAYWMGGAYLMAVKRYAEFRFIDDPARAGLYRRSFKFYSERTLLLSCIYYALMSAFFLGVFMIKYRIELLLSIPFLSLLFVWYFDIGARSDSAAQRPERLYREKNFMAYVACVGVICTLLLVIDMDWLTFLMEYHLIPVTELLD